MKTSDQTDKIDAALAKAQSELENPTKDATNPHFRSKYATLDAGLNIVRSVLSKHGISVTQPTGFEDGVLMLYTRLACAGQWIQSEYPVSQFPVKQQELGSCLTYSRRYSLFSLVGIAGEEDDDANAVTSPTPAPKRAPKAETVQLLSADDSSRERDVLLKNLTLCTSSDEMLAWAQNTAQLRNKLHTADREALKAAYLDLQKSLKKEAA